MLENLNALEILKLGFVGIALLLAVLTYLLLLAEQKVQPSPRVNMLRMIGAFMAFSLILATGSFFIQIQPDSERLNDYKTTLVRLDSLIDAKVLVDMSNTGQLPELGALAGELDKTMNDAKERGLLD